jgi:ABC-2 type transport system ATP-binding protein
MTRKAEKAIIIENLTKNFEVSLKGEGLIGGISALIAPKKKRVSAVKSISFTINEGELVGFIGPNGAGKTTTLKILSGLLYPTFGFVQVVGYTPWDRKPDFLKNISLVMGQKNQLWWDLPAVDSFELNKEIYQISDDVYSKTLNELLSLLDVQSLVNVQVRRLSLGQRMRLELVAALLHQPQILFLDEPTLGLDVVAQQTLRDFIYEYNRKRNATILLTSHNMDDVADLTKRVIVIDKGEILFDGQITELVGQFAKEKIIKVYLSKETDFKKFEKIGKVKRIDYPQVTLSVARGTSASAAAEILQNFPIADLTIDEEPIEEIIRRVFDGEMLANKLKKRKVKKRS